MGEVKGGCSREIGVPEGGKFWEVPRGHTSLRWVRGMTPGVPRHIFTRLKVGVGPWRRRAGCGPWVGFLHGIRACEVPKTRTERETDFVRGTEEGGGPTVEMGKLLSRPFGGGGPSGGTESPTQSLA